MWGYGVPDSSTIAAYLQASVPDGVCICELCRSGFNSTQNLLRLLELLQAGDVPDVVIFMTAATM
ncbi:MAG: hypothetical protein U0694_05960 [Anaerolineae bacterium]